MVALTLHDDPATTTSGRTIRFQESRPLDPMEVEVKEVNNLKKCNPSK